MINSAGYFDWAHLMPGQPEDAYSWNNTMENIYFHSMVGYVDTTSNLRWCGSVRYDGTLEQHFPVFLATPHGGPHANPFGPGFEAEGGVGQEHGGAGYDEPLTDAQVRTYLRIISDMEDYTGRTYPRQLWSGVGLVEHKEAPAPTACPSGRYARLWEAVLGEDMATLEELERSVLLIGSYVAGFPDGKEYSSIPELNAYFTVFTNQDLILSIGLGNTQKALEVHTQAPEAHSHWHNIDNGTTGKPLTEDDE